MIIDFDRTTNPACPTPTSLPAVAPGQSPPGPRRGRRKLPLATSRRADHSVPSCGHFPRSRHSGCAACRSASSGHLRAHAVGRAGVDTRATDVTRAEERLSLVVPRPGADAEGHPRPGGSALVVPSRADDPPFVAFPTCWGMAAVPAAQHWSSLGRLMPERIGSGTSLGKYSGVQVSPPPDVDATSLMSVRRRLRSNRSQWYRWCP